MRARQWICEHTAYNAYEHVNVHVVKALFVKAAAADPPVRIWYKHSIHVHSRDMFAMEVHIDTRTTIMHMCLARAISSKYFSFRFRPRTGPGLWIS